MVFEYLADDGDASRQSRCLLGDNIVNDRQHLLVKRELFIVWQASDTVNINPALPGFKEAHHGRLDNMVSAFMGSLLRQIQPASTSNAMSQFASNTPLLTESLPGSSIQSGAHSPQPPPLGMTPASRYDSNLRVMRRRDPSILSIIDQFSHVCVYQHNGNNWEKHGVEGSMFLFER